MKTPLTIEQIMTDVTKPYMFELRKAVDQLPEEFLNSYCLYTTYFHIYSEGINGVNRNNHVYLLNKTMGWPYAAAAYKYAKDNGIKNKEEKGRPRTHIGYRQYTRTVMTVREFLNIEFKKLGAYLMWSQPREFEILEESFRY